VTVNSISGLNQYINPQNTEASNPKDTMVKQQTNEPSKTDLNSNTSDLTKQAFKINITHKAKQIYAANANNTDSGIPVADESKLPINNNGVQQQAKQMINLIA